MYINLVLLSKICINDAGFQIGQGQECDSLLDLLAWSTEMILGAASDASI